MTMHSTWNGPTSDDFAAIEKLRTKHSALMKRVGKSPADTRDDAHDRAERAARFAEKLAGRREVETSQPAPLRAGIFVIGAGFAAACALGAVVVWSAAHRVTTGGETPRLSIATTLPAPLDSAAKNKLAEAMRAAAPGDIWSAVAPAQQPPASPQPPVASAEVADLRDKASALIGDGQISGARALLERAARADDSAAIFALAQTYDPQVLQRWKTVGLAGDEARARDLYQKAANAGSTEARQRLDELER